MRLSIVPKTERMPTKQVDSVSKCRNEGISHKYDGLRNQREDLKSSEERLRSKGDSHNGEYKCVRER